ncbi:hypothetical protein HK102_001884 [Quaeritorhiza haematococci]|nr:hypothetical protein HK102_001884 [Quaeritorhiza haematococci]
MGDCNLEGHQYHILRDDCVYIVFCNCQNHTQNHSQNHFQNHSQSAPRSIVQSPSASEPSPTSVPSNLPLTNTPAASEWVDLQASTSRSLISPPPASTASLDSLTSFATTPLTSTPNSQSFATIPPSSVALGALDGTRVTDKELLFFTNLSSPSPHFEQPLHQVRAPRPQMDQVEHRNIRPTDVFSPTPMNGVGAITNNTQIHHVSSTHFRENDFLTVRPHTSSPSISPPPSLHSGSFAVNRLSRNNGWQGVDRVQRGGLGFDVPVCLLDELLNPYVNVDAGEPDVSGRETSTPKAERVHPEAVLGLHTSSTAQADSSLPPPGPSSATNLFSNMCDTAVIIENSHRAAGAMVSTFDAHTYANTNIGNQPQFSRVVWVNSSDISHGIIAQHVSESQYASGLNNNTTTAAGFDGQQQSQAAWGFSSVVQHDNCTANDVWGNSCQTCSSSGCVSTENRPNMAFQTEGVSPSVSQDRLTRDLALPTVPHQPLAPAPSQRPQSPNAPTTSPQSLPHWQSVFLNPTASIYLAHPSEILTTVLNTTCTVTTPSQLFGFSPQNHCDSQIIPQTATPSASTIAAAVSVASSTPPGR